jgi:hypothetical protein
LPIRLMVGLLYLKHAVNESDESVSHGDFLWSCERWSENVYFQYFCGEEYFQACLPCDPCNLVRFRQALGEAGEGELLATTIAAAVQIGAIQPTEFGCVTVDTTVMEKAEAYPTDSRLLNVARARWCSWPAVRGSHSSRALPSKAICCAGRQPVTAMRSSTSVYAATLGGGELPAQRSTVLA